MWHLELADRWPECNHVTTQIAREAGKLFILARHMPSSKPEFILVWKKLIE
jgi:hypothetical protein